MQYIGIDLHRDNFHAVVMDEVGQVQHSHKYANTRQDVEQLLGQCGNDRHAVIEATRNWMWLVDLLREKDCQVTMAHPLKTKAIVSAKVKTDTIDATTLANLLRTDYVPASYIATPQEQEWRELGRTRISLVRQRTWFKNQIHAILAKQNLRCPVAKDLFCQKGRQWLETAEVSPAKRIAIQHQLAVLESVESQISALEDLIRKKAQSMPGVKYLKSIPGVGPVTAFTLASEIGDISRFDNPKQLASYLGIVPRLYQSGNTSRYGRITKQGNPYVRWLLVQASHRVTRKDMDLKLFHAKVTGRSNKKKATVAVARKLLVLCWVLLTQERRYQHRTSLNYQPKQPKTD